MRRRFGILLSAGLAFLGLAFSNGVANATVSSTPALTPQLATTSSDKTIEQVRQLTICNNGPGGAPIVYAVGLFTDVKNGNSTLIVHRKNAFAFSAVSPYHITSWNPQVNGQVDTVACAPDGSVLIGGTFSAVGTTTTGVRNIARVDNLNGAALPFTPAPLFSGRVAHIEVVQGHALVGGYFPGYLRSIKPTTGANDGYTLPAISGHYSYTDAGQAAAANATRIWNMNVSPDGKAVLMTGVFTSVGGQHHEQIFRLNMGSTAGTVSPWNPTELYSHCYYREPFWAQDATWSPDMRTIFVGTTGYRLAGDTNPNSHTRTGPCDAAIAYSATQASFSGHTWINYTGCDSLFSVAADASTLFIAGHERNIDNPSKGGCDTDTPPPPGRKQPGLGEITPSTGKSQPGPSRGRGLGADDMVRTAAGLWIASDNQANTSTCAGKGGHMGICYLPN